jgi:hypothetical protein
MRLECGAALCWLITLLLPVLGCGGSSGPGGSTPGIDTLEPAPRVLGYVRGDVYPRLVLEVDRVVGFGPRTSTEQDLARRLEAILDKPAGVEMVTDAAIASRGSDHAWTLAELDALTTQHFDLPVASGTTKIHVLFVDGRYDSGPGGGTVLGIAWKNQNIAIFKQVIEENCAAAGLGLLTEAACAAAELAICLHEVGHVIGLVDNGLPMVTPHEDTAHPGHDVSQDCVMYWAYEGDALISRVADDLLGSGSSALDFDADCLADIAAVRDAP